ncbi:MAG: hypothetical protein JWN66_4265 [Sphingomonas bacterium]|uniref:hypothetical protein n=1 Tax=Sphingomonas bacterium TaxID=1895847 RepID=UPI002633D2B0|nr:hypothetical protein [Sphingomonas bacterium]MDB5707149.1 hypothetical protein [Sphingomonas bacterium]
MKLDMAGVLSDAWRMWKRDHDLLIRVAGLFFFLPQFALLLLVTPAPQKIAAGADEQAMRAWLQTVMDWYGANGAGLVAAAAFALFGALTVMVLYLDRSRPDLRGALGAALRLLPAYLFTAFLVLIPVWLGLALFIVPGIYAQGRLLLAGPALVAEPEKGATGAVARSMTLTRGHWLVLGAIACFVLFGGNILAAPFIALGTTLDGAPIANPVAAALLNAGAAVAMTVAALATILVRIALYRRLAQPSSGI